jgi:hypothetical protein
MKPLGATLALLQVLATVFDFVVGTFGQRDRAGRGCCRPSLGFGAWSN